MILDGSVAFGWCNVAEAPRMKTGDGFWRQPRRNPERNQRYREKLRRRLAHKDAPDYYET